MEESQNKKNNHEIDVIGIIKKVLSEKKLLCIFIAAFAVIGVIYALNTQKTYTSTVQLAPEITSSGGMAQNISELASMVGVDLSSAGGSSVDAIYPEIYPDVISSSDFITQLFAIKVTQLEDIESKTYYDHLVLDPKIPFWSYPSIWISNIFSKDEENDTGHTLNPFKLTKAQSNICDAIRGNITCQVDKKTSVITVTVKDIDPLVAATMADTVQKRLKEYITLYRTKKARNDLEYSEILYKKAKEEYTKARQTYASYADANEGLVLQSFISKRDELENEMQLKFNMYNQVAQQLQLAKARLQEKTPVFTVIQSATVPIKASSTPRSIMVFLFVFLGVCADVVWVLYIRDSIKQFQKKK